MHFKNYPNFDILFDNDTKIYWKLNTESLFIVYYKQSLRNQIIYILGLMIALVKNWDTMCHSLYMHVLYHIE